MKYFIGQKASLRKVITTNDVLMFAEMTGDKNKIHLDENYAKGTMFKEPIAHGVLCAGLISSVIANVLPGDGTIYLGQELNFVAPVFHNDNLIAEVEIIEIINEKNQMILNTTVRKDDGKIVITGIARVKNFDI